MDARIALTGGLAFAASCAALIAAPVAGATTYNNDTPILIPASGAANPYPSSITVSGTSGPITDVNVGLDGLSHSNSVQVSIALVAPSGQALMFQGCAGGSPSGVFLTFDDDADDQLPPLDPATGTFKPTSHCVPGPTFPAPGPLTTYGKPAPEGTATFASAFTGLSAIGTWNLYVLDTAAPASGSIPGGWSLDVKPDVTPLPAAAPIPTPAPSPTKKKCKKKKGANKGASAAAKRCKKKR
jgi:hypothetical protein